MVRKLLTKTTKVVLITTASVFALLAASSAYTSERSYILNGASQATMISLIQQVGGEVQGNIDVTSGISATLTEQQVELLKESSPLLRINEAGVTKVAGFVWDRPRKKTRKVAGFVWDRPRKKTRKVAGFVWDRPRKKTRKVAGFVWDRPRKKTSKTM